MDETYFDGRFSVEPGIGSQDDYVVCQLASGDLLRLAALIRSRLDTATAWQVNIGQGRLRFEAALPNHFTVEALDDGTVIVRSGRSDLEQIATRFERMAHTKLDPDDLVHTHLENCFTSLPKGISDIVFERLDEFHPRRRPT